MGFILRVLIYRFPAGVEFGVPTDPVGVFVLMSRLFAGIKSVAGFGRDGGFLSAPVGVLRSWYK